MIMAPKACHIIILVVLLLQQDPRVSAVQVETKYGTVEGKTFVLEDFYHGGKAIDVYYAIPFAKPPVGDLRFALPEEPEPWDDVFVADTHGLRCPQGGTYSEDCLHLNIMAPSDMSGGPYPVMFFIYGGSYQSGYNTQYFGHFLAAHDIVYVIPNYRVNRFGFAYSGDEHIPGNMGLWDNRLALQFVQENIAAFGGDPDKVTIFGQSSGAMSVGMLVVSPIMAGLFHQAIYESGSEMAARSVNGPDQEPENYIAQVADDLGCPTDDTGLMTACLRNKTAEEIRTASWECADGYRCVGMAPVVDGPGGVLPELPAVLRETEQINEVPCIVGITRHDGFSFCTSCPTREEFEDIIRRYFEFYIPRGLTDKQIEDSIAATDFYYSPWPHLDDRNRNRHILCEAVTDGRYGFSADLGAKLHSEYAPVHYFIFDFEGENVHDYVPEWWGAAHSVELVYTYGAPFIRHNPEIREDSGISDLYEYTDEDDQWAIFMMTLWTNFAKYGNPTPEPVEVPGGSQPLVWSEFSNEKLSYVHFTAANTSMKEDYRQRDYAFWREYSYYIVPEEDRRQEAV